MRSAAFTAALLLPLVRAALGAECNVLTPADIKAVTGAARGTSTGNQVTGLEHSSHELAEHFRRRHRGDKRLRSH